MTNVNPNLRTFSDMYKGGYQPLFVSLTPDANAVPQNGNSPQLQPQPGQDSVEIGGQKKTGKGKKIALTGLAIAAAAAAAATAVHFLGGKGTPADVKNASRLAQSFVGEAQTALSGAEKLAQTAADDVARVQNSGAADIKGVKEAAKDVAEAVKGKVDYAMNLFFNDGKNDAGEIVAQFFDKDGQAIADISGKFGSEVTMKYTSPTAANEVISAFFNSGSIDSLSEMATDGRVLRNISSVKNGFIVSEGIENIADNAVNVAQRYEFRGSLEKASEAKVRAFYQDLVLDAGEKTTAGKYVARLQNMPSEDETWQVNNAMRFVRDEKTGVQTIADEVALFSVNGDEAKLSILQKDANLSKSTFARQVELSPEGKLQTIKDYGISDDNGENISEILTFDALERPTSYSKTIQGENNGTYHTIGYHEGEMSNYRLSESMPDPESENASMRVVSEVNFLQDGKIKDFEVVTNKEGKAAEKLSLEYSDGAPVKYQELTDETVEKSYEFNGEEKKWDCKIKEEPEEVPTGTQGEASQTETHAEGEPNNVPDSED